MLLSLYLYIFVEKTCQACHDTIVLYLMVKKMIWTKYVQKKLFILVVPVLQNQSASSQHCQIVQTFNDHSGTFFIERAQIAISPQAVASVDQDALLQLQLQCQLLLYLLFPHYFVKDIIGGKLPCGPLFLCTNSGLTGACNTTYLLHVLWQQPSHSKLVIYLHLPISYDFQELNCGLFQKDSESHFIRFAPHVTTILSVFIHNCRIHTSYR